MNKVPVVFEISHQPIYAMFSGNIKVAAAIVITI